ncbi:hypothetical protein LDENG_00083400 [Lucifuga dentata]|nr:hypothetical protein LDENG_00083400 [Lucifuga dentata]
MKAVNDFQNFLPALLTLILNFKTCLPQEENMTFTEDYDLSSVDYSLFVEQCLKESNRQFRLWFMSIFYSIICFLGLAGNLLVILTFFYFKRLKTMTDFYLLNLSFADLLFALSLPFWASNAMSEWVLGLIMCKIMHSIYKVSFYSSMFLLCCISIDRYFAISKAVSAHRHRTQAVFLSKVSSAVIWMMALVFSVPEITYTTINNNTCTPFSSSADRFRIGIQASQIVLGFAIPLLVMCFCYSNIVQTLCQARSFERNKAIKVILAVVSVFLLCQTPYNVALFWATIVTAQGGTKDCNYENNLLYANDITQGVAFLRCCLNPFVYAFIGVKFRHDLLKLLKDWGCMSQERFYKIKNHNKLSKLSNMMMAANGMSHTIPTHVLRVGQTIRLDSTQETANQYHSLTDPSGNHGDPDLGISLDNLNKLILELDPTFEPIQVNKSPPCISSPTVFSQMPSSEDSYSDEDVANCVLVPRGCSPCPFPSMVPSLSPSIPIPERNTRSCSPQGSLVFSSSPTSSRPPLPCGSFLRRNPSPRSDAASQGSLCMSNPNRNSVTSLLSTSPGSDTSYILGSCLSLASEDSESPESLLTCTSGSFSDVSKIKPSDMKQSPDKISPTKPTPLGHFQQLHGEEAPSSPASLTDIPVVLINGAPQPDLHNLPSQPPEIDLTETIRVSPNKQFSPHGFQAHWNGSQPSMKFVMDTSNFWFRPHINRAEAEALVKDKEPGTFVVRDSTSYRGSFGLAMKVDHMSVNFSATAPPDESSSEVVKHFLIESSAKGVRIKGSSHEPYFGSLSALVYQHTISAYALPCKLLLHSKVPGTEESVKDKPTSEDKSKTACNFLYLNAVPTEMLTGPCSVQKAVSSTLGKASGAITPTVVNLKVSLKGVTLTDINRKLFFRRHYPAHLLSYSGEDPDKRLWIKGCSFGTRMFGFVTKGVEAGMENVCHVFAEYDPLQPYNKVIEFIQAAVSKP